MYKRGLIMKMINIENELATWVIDYITNSVHNSEAENSPEFNKWAKSFERDEAAVLVNMEFGPYWGYDKRTEVTEKEAEQYAEKLLKIVFDNWSK
jgi:hypothetical protein